MASKLDDLKEIYCSSRKLFRQWLLKNHTQTHSIWLIIYKKGAAKKSVSYPEAVEEALCFGWIDSRPNKIDADSYKIIFAPRKPKSVWSKVNKKKIDELIEAGLMHEAGQSKIEAAIKNGSWAALDNVEEYIMPADLAKAFSKNKKAVKYFDAFPPFAKKQILSWIASAKQPETKQKRIAETVALAAENKRANQYQRKT